ncbi:MAG: quinone-dependent dihydroorotate dehydrogenase [Methanobacteriota archaeon]
MVLYKALLRPFLFQMDPEAAHHRAVDALERVHRSPVLQGMARGFFPHRDPSLRTTVCGLEFENPVGLAAGFDKDARLVQALATLGFGFIEVGTLTPRAQTGNPGPRIFRVRESKALVNRLGFNNEGVDAARLRLAASMPMPLPVGINLGKNKDTPNERAVDDYRYGLEELYSYGSYFVVNVSSPNTPGLRSLQEPDALRPLLSSLLSEIERLAADTEQARKPLFVKVGPDLADDALVDLARLFVDVGVDGVIATNTTVSHAGLPGSAPSEGGVSGAPLRERSTDVIRLLFRETGGRLPVIGVGGIFTAEDAWEKITAGASLVQVYTSLIYEGPGTPGRLCKGIARRLDDEGLNRLEDAVGIAAK